MRILSELERSTQIVNYIKQVEIYDSFFTILTNKFFKNTTDLFHN